jgi:hypothetical protein
MKRFIGYSLLMPFCFFALSCNDASTIVKGWFENSNADLKTIMPEIRYVAESHSRGKPAAPGAPLSVTNIPISLKLTKSVTTVELPRYIRKVKFDNDFVFTVNDMPQGTTRAPQSGAQNNMELTLSLIEWEEDDYSERDTGLIVHIGTETLYYVITFKRLNTGNMCTAGETHIVDNGDGTKDEIHIFKYDPSNDTGGQTVYNFIAYEDLTGVRVLVVAGGGAGGDNNQNGNSAWCGAGGGAGGLYYASLGNIGFGEYSVKTGRGGTGITSSNFGGSGVNSSLNGISGVNSNLNINMRGGGGGSKKTNFGDGFGNSGGSGGGSTRGAEGGSVINGSVTGAPLQQPHGYIGGSGAWWPRTDNANSGFAWYGANKGGGGGGAGAKGSDGGNGNGSAVRTAGGGKGRTWADIGDIISPAMLGLPETLAGIAGGGNANSDPLVYNRTDPNRGGGAFGGGLFADNSLIGTERDGINGTGGGGAIFGAGGSGGDGIVILRFNYHDAL